MAKLQNTIINGHLNLNSYLITNMITGSGGVPTLDSTIEGSSIFFYPLLGNEAKSWIFIGSKTSSELEAAPIYLSPSLLIGGNENEDVVLDPLKIGFNSDKVSSTTPFAVFNDRVHAPILNIIHNEPNNYKTAIQLTSSAIRFSAGNDYDKILSFGNPYKYYFNNPSSSTQEVAYITKTGRYRSNRPSISSLVGHQLSNKIHFYASNQKYVIPVAGIYDDPDDTSSYRHPTEIDNVDAVTCPFYLNAYTKINYNAQIFTLGNGLYLITGHIVSCRSDRETEGAMNDDFNYVTRCKKSAVFNIRLNFPADIFSVNITNVTSVRNTEIIAYYTAGGSPWGGNTGNQANSPSCALTWTSNVWLVSKTTGVYGDYTTYNNDSTNDNFGDDDDKETVIVVSPAHDSPTQTYDTLASNGFCFSIICRNKSSESRF